MARSAWASWDLFWTPQFPFFAPETFRILIQNLTFSKKCHFFAHFSDPWISILRSRNVQELVPKPLRGTSPKWPFTPSIWRKQGKCLIPLVVCRTDTHRHTDTLTHKYFQTPKVTQYLVSLRRTKIFRLLHNRPFGQLCGITLCNLAFFTVRY